MNYVFDIDGTLSFDGETIAPPILAAIRSLQQCGHQVIFASARPIRDLLPMIPGFEDGLLIGANGALIADNRQIRPVAPITSRDLQRVTELIASERLSYIADSCWNYAAQVDDTQPILNQLDPQQLAQKVALPELNEVIKVILVGLTMAQSTRLSAQLQAATGLTIVQHTAEGNLDLTASKINKWSTLQRLGITRYVAFGNDENDRQLLQHATTSVWVQSKSALNRLGQQLTDSQCSPTSVVEKIRALAD
ncbi:HAD-IIB family hydrolase [Lactiplantibacillus paraplantarum]|uniref:HAD-IIB family hydrolase n=1 Tax=Lactiplantibacillus paraplantarum TaxID=60520 RepID=UPI003DA41EB2